MLLRRITAGVVILAAGVGVQPASAQQPAAPTTVPFGSEADIDAAADAAVPDYQLSPDESRLLAQLRDARTRLEAGADELAASEAELSRTEAAETEAARLERQAELALRAAAKRRQAARQDLAQVAVAGYILGASPDTAGGAADADSGFADDVTDMGRRRHYTAVVEEVTAGRHTAAVEAHEVALASLRGAQDERHAARKAVQSALRRLRVARKVSAELNGAVAELRRAADSLDAVQSAAWTVSGGRIGAVLANRARAQGATQAAPAGQLDWPVTGRLGERVTSRFGPRIHPIFGTARMHAGVDIGVPSGTPVRAAADGQVVVAGGAGGYGNVVVVDHGGGLATLSAHNSRLMVEEEASVRRGQIVAFAGSTGYSTGPHVHFEVRVNGQPADPLPWLAPVPAPDPEER